jgi:hypothetical protein
MQRQNDVHDEVEGDKGGQNVVGGHLGQIGLAELHCEENGDNADNLKRASSVSSIRMIPRAKDEENT